MFRTTKYIHAFRRFCSNGSVAEVKEPKQSRMKQLGGYLKRILDDYKMVAVETGQDMKEHPIKATVYISLLSAVSYLIKTCPSEASFYKLLLEDSNELLQIGDPIRNPTSEAHLQKLRWCYNRGEIRRFSIAVCCVIWQDNFDKDVDVYEAHCDPLKVGWLDMKDRVLDVGVAGKWLWTEKAMIDYDINPEEWVGVEQSPSST